VDGDALSLSYADNSFDVVCEFGALHHIQKPSAAVAEMLRVSRHAVFISDCNNFGQGGKGSRLIKRALNAIGAWPLANWLKTGGKGYTISDGDGLAYSYSVFNDFEQVARKCRSVHMLNTVSAGPNFYISAPQVALLGIK
jgi:ubiquinone/menaquinone biosynthesis C-methylase UbiE